MEKLFNENVKIKEVQSAFYVMPQKGHKGIRGRMSHGFVYMCGAKRHYTFENGREYVTRKGDIFYIPKNSGYVLDTEITGDCYIINFDFVEEYEGEEFILSPKNTNEILRHFENAENMWRTRQTGYYEKTLSELYEIIYNIKKSMAPSYVPKSRAAVIEPAMKYIYENYTSENIGISDLASLCGISEQYLRQIFRSVHGVSPLKFINNLKISRAKELIKYGQYSIHQAAQMSGFFDDSYFCREFKKSTGVSPKEYSKS